MVILGYNVSDEPIRAREKCYPPVWLMLITIITIITIELYCDQCLPIGIYNHKQNRNKYILLFSTGDEDYF